MQIINSVIQNLRQQNVKELAEIKKIRQNPVISIFVHPITRSTLNEVHNLINSQEFVSERAKVKNKKNLDVIIDSGGGDVDAAYHIAKVLHENSSGKISYIIPRFAKSAATLLISGGDEIVMSATSELGPLDPQIKQDDNTYISAKAVESTLELIKKYIKEDGETGLKLASVISARINPLVLGQYQSTMAIGKTYQKELLQLRMYPEEKDEKKVSDIVEKFSFSYTHHSRVIDCNEAKEIFGKNKVEIVKGEVWSRIWNFYQNSKAISDLSSVLRLLQKQKDDKA